MISEDGIKYSYNDNGNLVRKDSLSETVDYTYNYENKLIKVLKKTSSGVEEETYSYNQLGSRIQKVSNGVVTNYLVDDNTTYSRVLEENNDEGGLIVSYVYGHDLISQKRNNEVSFYIIDGLGSTTALTNSYGEITDTYTYDAFGNLLDKTGTTENNYLFAGEQQDKLTGQYYLRARYFDTTTGRFTTMDNYLGSIQDPTSLHKYLYAHANPVNYTDPSGNVTLNDLLASMNIRNTLMSINVKVTTIFVNMNASAGGRYVIALSIEIIDASLDGDLDALEILFALLNAGMSANGTGDQGDAGDVDIPRPKGTADDVSYKRPSRFRKGVRDDAWENAKNANGDVIDPLTGKVMDKSEPWDMGHKPGFEFRKHRKSAEERGIPRKQFLDEYNNPDHYRPELPSSNRSHKGEDLTDDYFGD